MNFYVYHQHVNEILHLNQHIQVENGDCSLAIESTFTVDYHIFSAKRFYVDTNCFYYELLIGVDRFRKF